MATKDLSLVTDAPTDAPTDGPPQVLGRQEVLARMRTRIATKWITVPEWGTKHLVRGMNAGEKDAYDSHQMSLQTTARSDKTDIRIKQLRAQAVAQCTINEDGSRYFEKGDIYTIAEANSKAVGRLFAGIMELSNFTAEDQQSEVEAMAERLGPSEESDIFST